MAMSWDVDAEEHMESCSDSEYEEYPVSEDEGSIDWLFGLIVVLFHVVTSI